MPPLLHLLIVAGSMLIPSTGLFAQSSTPSSNVIRNPSEPWWKFADSDGDVAICQLNRSGKLHCEPESNYRHGEDWRIEADLLILGSEDGQWNAKGSIKGSRISGTASNGSMPFRVELDFTTYGF